MQASRIRIFFLLFKACQLSTLHAQASIDQCPVLALSQEEARVEGLIVSLTKDAQVSRSGDLRIAV